MTTFPDKKRIDVSSNDLHLLLRQARNGSQCAYREIVLQFQSPVRLFLMRHIRCATWADDLAQEVFVAAFQQLERFNGDSGFGTWLLGIAKNKARHFLRTELRRQKNQERFAEDESIRQRLDGLESDGEFEFHQNRLLALRSCIEQLPIHSRLLIQQFYHQRLSAAIIADNLGQSSGAIRMKLLRVRKILQACINRKLGNSNTDQGPGNE